MIHVTPLSPSAAAHSMGASKKLEDSGSGSVFEGRRLPGVELCYHSGPNSARRSATWQQFH